MGCSVGAVSRPGGSDPVTLQTVGGSLPGTLSRTRWRLTYRRSRSPRRRRWRAPWSPSSSPVAPAGGGATASPGAGLAAARPGIGLHRARRVPGGPAAARRHQRHNRQQHPHRPTDGRPQPSGAARCALAARSPTAPDAIRAGAPRGASGLSHIQRVLGAADPAAKHPSTRALRTPEPGDRHPLVQCAYSTVSETGSGNGKSTAG